MQHVTITAGEQESMDSVAGRELWQKLGSQLEHACEEEDAALEVSCPRLLEGARLTSRIHAPMQS